MTPDPGHEALTRLSGLADATSMTLVGRLTTASNATFVADLDGRRVVYKPVAGERPLWDFPDGTLAEREYAAHLVSEETGWGIVPPTWLADGPHGPGMVQEWQDIDAAARPVDILPGGESREGFLPVFDGVDGDDRPVTLVHEDSAALRRMAIFDALTNNSDRKGGHVLPMSDGRRLGVDHGLTFHVEPKMRTVLWGWAGEPFDDDERATLESLSAALDGSLGEALSALLTAAEVDETRARCRALAQSGTFPVPHQEWPVIPWPPF